MQIVIDIDEEFYSIITDEVDLAEVKNPDHREIYRIVKDSTLLPKGHGRLIDADMLREHMYTCETNGRPFYVMELNERLGIIDEVPTIIEADRGGVE